MFWVFGANHNFFNTFWDPNETSIPANDDWDFLDAEYCVPDNPDSGRLSSEEQRGSLIAIGSAFFRTYLRNEKAFRPFLTSEAPPPIAAQSARATRAGISSTTAVMRRYGGSDEGDMRAPAKKKDRSF